MLNNFLIRSSTFKYSARFFTFCNRRYNRASSSQGYLRPKKTHYEILGLKPDASPAEIRSAFVQLSKQIHPDKNPDDPDNHSKFILLNEAYTVLSKPMSRREYDVSLAHWLYRQQSAARAGYTSHSAGNEPSPGFGRRTESYDGNSQQRVFWDETIWYMRDRSKDANAFYDQDSYYGIKGIRRQSNLTIVALCLVIIALGFVYFYIGFRYTVRKQYERLEKIDRQNLRILKEIRERAKQNGTIKQLEILSSRSSARTTKVANQKSDGDRE